MSEETVVVGRIVRAHGLRGEVLVTPASDVPERFLDLGQVFVVGVGESRTAHEVEEVRPHGDAFVVKLHGVEDPESARRLLTGKALCVARDRVPASGADESYHFELIGLEVVRTDGRKVGRLVEILETGANDVYVVRGPEGEVLLPATREVIERVDAAAGTLWVRPIPGLFAEGDEDEADDEDGERGEVGP
jgi:16S rRNA processing protein RimM